MSRTDPPKYLSIHIPPSGRNRPQDRSIDRYIVLGGLDQGKMSKMIVTGSVLLALLSVVGSAEELSQEQEVEETSLLPSLLKTSISLFEGRGKKGGNQGGVLIGGMMIAMALAALAALSGKAAAASMAALMLAAASLLKKGSDGGGHHSSYDIISHARRSLLERGYPQYSYQESVPEIVSPSR